MERQGSSRSLEESKQDHEREFLHELDSCSHKNLNLKNLNLLKSRKENLDREVQEISIPYFPERQSLKKKIIEHCFKKKECHVLQKKSSWLKEIRFLYDTAKEIFQFPEMLLKTYSLSHYKECQLIYHERGELLVKSYIQSANKKLIESTFSVSEFNSLFNHVKKSKLKNFFQSQIQNDCILTVGSFLAIPLDLSNHRALILISRNDFLPPEEKEIQEFENFMNHCKSLLDYLLGNEKVQNKETLYKSAIENLPLPIQVVDGKEKVVLRNRAYIENKKLIRSNSLGLREINLKKNVPIWYQIYKEDKDTVISDHHHFQRVSLLGELLNTLKHELSNPLFGLQLSSELAAYDFDDPDAIESLNDITASSKRCQNIIENFSNLCEFGNQEKVDIRELIKEILILTKSESREVKKFVKFNGFLDENDYFQLINPVFITQIIFNLVVNSVQAIKSKDTVSLEDRVEVDTFLNKEKQNLRIEIKDTGPGISEENIPHIFTTFYTTKEKGTGLGLPICRTLAKKMKGKLYYSKDYESGAKFVLEIDLKQRDIVENTSY